MVPFFTSDNTTVAFETRFHFGWYAHGREAKWTAPKIQAALRASFVEVSDRCGYHVLESEMEPNAVRALLSLKPENAPAQVTRFVKGNLATTARNEFGLSQVWSRGWFVRGVGHVTNDVVQQYVASQYEHHRGAPFAEPAAVAKACYRHQGDPAALRRSNHAMFEYNVHLVFVTQQRRELLDLEVAESLLNYLRRVCDEKGWLPWTLNVVGDHAHLLLGLRPNESPADVALSLLNNSEFFLQQRYARVWRDQVSSTVWRPGFYVGTVGSATTAQVKAFLG